MLQSRRARRGRARASRVRRGGAARELPGERGRAGHRHRRRPAAPLDLPPEVAAATALAQVPERKVWLVKCCSGVGSGLLWSWC